MNWEIFRPRCLTEQDWEAMGRDGQTAWWDKVHPDRRLPNRVDPLAVAAAYMTGYCTRDEMSLHLRPRLTRENIDEFLSLAPQEVIDFLLEDSASAPADDDEAGWSRCFILRSDCSTPGPGGRASPEAREASMRAEVEAGRAGLRVFREAWARNSRQDTRLDSSR